MNTPKRSKFFPLTKHKGQDLTINLTDGEVTSVKITNRPEQRAGYYNTAFPNRVPLSEKNGMVGGCWMIGAAFRNPSRMPDGSPFYGSYPHGYLERVHAMFPDAKKILHVFSGGLTYELAIEPYLSSVSPKIIRSKEIPFTAVDTEYPLECMELVDLGGEGRHPTWEGNVDCMPAEWEGRFDLVLADPPYSPADAGTYGVPMYSRRKALTELHRVTATAGNLVWLDQVWPMHRKDQWKTWATIGLVRSTQHRMRLVTFFERQS